MVSKIWYTIWYTISKKMVSKNTLKAGRNLKDHPDRSDHFLLLVSTVPLAGSMLYF